MASGAYKANKFSSMCRPIKQINKKVLISNSPNHLKLSILPNEYQCAAIFSFLLKIGTSKYSKRDVENCDWRRS